MLVMFYAFLLAVSQFFYKQGMNQIGIITLTRLKGLPSLAVKMACNPYLLCGIIIGIFSFCLWLIILSWLKLTIAFPLQAVQFIFVVLIAWLLLREKIMLTDWLAIGFILSGIVLLGRKYF